MIVTVLGESGLRCYVPCYKCDGRRTLLAPFVNFYPFKNKNRCQRGLTRGFGGQLSRFLSSCLAMLVYIADASELDEPFGIIWNS